MRAWIGRRPGNCSPASEPKLTEIAEYAAGKAPPRCGWPRRMTVAETSFAAIDFESAGIRRGSTEVPVQIGIALMHRLEISGNFGSFLFTEQPITWAAQKVHGICAKDLAGAPRLPELWPQVHHLLHNRWLVAHGSATERRFLRAFPFHGFGPWVDTLKLSRAVWPEKDSFALGDLVRALGLEDDLRKALPAFRWHDALSDAMASLILLRRAVADAKISEQQADLLLRPDATEYHRLKAQGFLPRSQSRSPGRRALRKEDFPLSDI
jgi:DNA polymerase III subunit epsilon